MIKEYKVIELLRPTDFTELPTGNTIVQANAFYIDKLLNDLGKEGWRLCWSLPDNNGTAIMERDVKETTIKSEEARSLGVIEAAILDLVKGFSEYEQAQANRKWWQRK